MKVGKEAVSLFKATEIYSTDIRKRKMKCEKLYDSTE
jgi:hypothetical protein